MAASSTGGPTHGPLSKIATKDEVALKEIKVSFEQLWTLPLPEMRIQMSAAPPQLPEDTPMDLIVKNRKVTVSDGTDVEIRS